MKIRMLLIALLMCSLIINTVLINTAFKNPFFIQNLTQLSIPSSKHCSYQYINPLRCEPDMTTKKKEYITLRNDIREYIDEQKKLQRITSGSVYFRDLHNGPSINIDSQTQFIPASLLKLPLMIMYYEKSETDPLLLQKRAVIAHNTETPNQNVIPKKSAIPGKSYTIDALITLMVTQSDNTSWKTLLTFLRDHFVEEDFIATLSDLGIVDPRKQPDQQYITVQLYASIFRILYNASYLNPDLSNKALQILSQSSYKNGIVKGVPTGVPVAHKFGEQKNGTEQQLHDCGIVYYPSNPYIICIMTRGDNISELEQVIQTISHMVYQEVDNRN